MPAILAFLAVALILIGAIAIQIPGIILRGFVLTKLWGWFIVPFGLSPLFLSWAIGVSLTVGLFTHQIPAKTKEEGSGGAQFMYYTFMPILQALAAWGIGAIVHSYM